MSDRRARCPSAQRTGNLLVNPSALNVTVKSNGNATNCPSLLVFSDDWGRHPSSCQHLIRQLLPKYQIWWVNTIGMRRPALNMATLSRGWEKVRHWFLTRQPGTPLPENLQVVSPRMWPWFSRPRDRWINQKLLTRSLKPIVEQHSPVVAITTLPIVADLVDHLPVARWVYYCVDDFSAWPGLDQLAMAEMEQQLVEKSDVLLAVSDTLQRKLAEYGRQGHLLTHGIELGFWNTNGDVDHDRFLAHYEQPLVVYWGVVDRRMDTALISQLASDMDSGTILLVGPTQDPDPEIFRCPRVVHLGPLPLDQLPSVAARARVLIMPYRDEPVTRAMQPLKMKEYLATGKPAVARQLPATQAWSDCLDLARTAEEFSILVRKRTVDGLPYDQRSSRKRLTNEGWDAKAKTFERLVLGDTSGRYDLNSPGRAPESAPADLTPREIATGGSGRRKS